jgi:hypothetical protein
LVVQLQVTLQLPQVHQKDVELLPENGLNLGSSAPQND